MPDKRNMLIIETWAVKFDPERVTHSQRAGKIELNGKVEQCDRLTKMKAGCMSAVGEFVSKKSPIVYPT